ncbi:MAG: PQQ-binding-like beta-propeller repeat protein [Bacteroidota bacterium]|nr:PQQ-binding-like beta-propeller repeat protein [Bacteroidota bacterium]
MRNKYFTKLAIILSFFLFSSLKPYLPNNRLLKKDNYKILWKYNIDKTMFFPQPAISEEIVFIGNDNGVLNAIDKRRGRVLWSFKIDKPIYKTPVIEENIIYFGGKDGYLYALYSKRGKLKWKFDAEEPISCNPFVINKLVYFNTKHFVYALDQEAGLDMIKSEYLYTGHPNICNNSNALFFNDDMKIHSLSLKDGKKLWQYDLNIFGASKVSVNDEVVTFINGNKIFVLNATDGKLKWKYEFENEESKFSKNVVIKEDKIYCSFANTVYAFSLKNGEPVWDRKIKTDYELSEIAIENNLIYLSDMNNSIYLIEIEKGKKIDEFEFEFKIKSPLLTVNDEIIYFINDENEMCAVKVTE